MLVINEPPAKRGKEVSYSVTVREYCDYVFDIVATGQEELKSKLAKRLDDLDCDDMIGGEKQVVNVDINRIISQEESNEYQKTYAERNKAF